MTFWADHSNAVAETLGLHRSRYACRGAPVDYYIGRTAWGGPSYGAEENKDESHSKVLAHPKFVEK